MPDYTFQGQTVPSGMIAALQRHVASGEPTGDFLTAVLENDLAEAVGRSDWINVQRLTAYVVWLYNEAPAACWGSKEKVAAWRATHQPTQSGRA